MSGLLIYCISLYIVSLILTYVFIRRITIEGNNDPNIKDILITITPLVNTFIAVVSIVYFVSDIFEGRRGERLVKKFFMLK
ncbi:hypothetical protein KDN24_06825 [Bacillus sp. Bva_UNVM-123]|uniref:hypothetical protein n=1 Tax=Bacillus sp. Bva_UNVM-123 TaxID=2829798 RepID=UPI00391EF0E1